MHSGGGGSLIQDPSPCTSTSSGISEVSQGRYPRPAWSCCRGRCREGPSFQDTRPEISGGCSQEDFKFFTRKWEQYVRSSNEKDGNKLKDQLKNCPDGTLRSALYNAMGDRIDTISVMDLLKEIEVLAVVNPVQQDREDQRSCTYCGQKSHGKSPDINLRKADCPAHGKKCAKCHQKGHYAGVITRRGDKKTTAGTNKFTINRMKMSEKSAKISRVSQSKRNMMKKQQNMKKLHHEVWD
jgi:hypothetical protein